MSVDLTQAQLHELFEYKDGALYEKVSRSNCKPVGEQTGWITKYGYRMTQIKRKNYMVHRLIYFMMKGEWPRAVDHINRNRLDNRIENLRPANASINAQNASIRKDNALGIRNVSWNKLKNCYVVQLSVAGKLVFHKYEKDLEAAELMAKLAREKYHKEFAYDHTTNR